ncbi:MAG TPA: hypothetical protein VG847_04920 [Chitinophagaceae bacterium]|nr:hypothetical protein [Chitinophagaceae bacterium]
MKKLITIVVILFVITLLSCGGASSGDAKKDTVTLSSPDQASSTVTDNDASFSCMLDGKEISGKGTDQNINAAFRLTGDDKGQIFFRLSDMNNIGDKFMFQVPDKTGSTTLSNFSGYTTADFANYIDDPVIVNITSVSASRIAGIFSGKYTLQQGTDNGNSKRTIEVTNGKFDIPFSTSADWKKLYHAE